MKMLRTSIALTLAGLAMTGSAVASSAPPGALGIIPIPVRNDLMVKGILPGGAAATMGVRLGDIITHAGGHRIGDRGRLARYARGLKAGDPVQLIVRRKGKSLTLNGTASAREPQMDRLAAY